MKKLLNRKQGGAMIGIALAIFIWIAGILAMPYITDSIDGARIGLSCGSPIISDGGRLTCLFVASVIPYFIWTLACLVFALLLGGFK